MLFNFIISFVLPYLDVVDAGVPEGGYCASTSTYSGDATLSDNKEAAAVDEAPCQVNDSCGEDAAEGCEEEGCATNVALSVGSDTGDRGYGGNSDNNKISSSSATAQPRSMYQGRGGSGLHRAPTWVGPGR